MNHRIFYCCYIVIFTIILLNIFVLVLFSSDFPHRNTLFVWYSSNCSTVTILKTHKTENKTSICPSLNYNSTDYLTNYTLTLNLEKHEIVSFFYRFCLFISISCIEWSLFWCNQLKYWHALSNVCKT